jgi:hypothetical protein
MKSKAIILLLLMLFVEALQAQRLSQKNQWFVGVSGGPQFGEAIGRGINVFNQTTAIGGLSLAYGLNEDVKLQMELMFDTRTIRANSLLRGFYFINDTSAALCANCDYLYDVSFTTHYLQIPLLIHYAKAKGNFQIALQAGAYYALLLSNTYDGVEILNFDSTGLAAYPHYGLVPGLTVTNFEGTSINVINTYDAGILVGLSANYYLGNRFTLTLDGRFQVGLVGMYENPEMPEITYKSYVVRFGLMYQLQQRNP